MGSNLPRLILYFIGLVFLQIVFKVYEIVLFDIAFCYVYVMFLLLIPVKIDRILFMILALFVGLTIDVFYNSLGMHAAACVMMAFVRPYVLQFITPQGGYELTSLLVATNTGLRWFALYGLSLLFVHHFTVHLIEASDGSLFFHSLGVAFFSSIYTFFIIVLLQYSFTKIKFKK